MEEVVVKGKVWFQDPADDGQVYFLLKARKWDAYRENLTMHTQE